MAKPLPLEVKDNRTVLTRLPYESLLRQIGAIADELGIEVYLVGGAVRDALLNRPTTDLDFVSIGAGSGIRLAQEIARKLGVGLAHVYPNFGTAAVRIPAGKFSDEPLVLEFVGARKESYRKNSRKPIVEEGTLADDLARRDFTINAMAVALNANRWGELIDPFHGLADLQSGILRTPLDPLTTFEDDPLRMLRAARFAAQLGFRIHPETFEAMKQKAHRIQIVSPERITDELQKIICAPRPSIGFKILYDAGLLQYILPELTALAGVETIEGYKHKDNFLHTLQVVDNVARMTTDRPCEETRWLRWAALLHDIAKSRTKRFIPGEGWTFHGHEERGARWIPRIFKRLRLPTDERMKYVQKLIRLHHRPVALVDEQVTDSAIRRLLFEAGDDIEDLMLLVRADITSRNPRRVRRYLEAFDRLEKRMAEVEEKDRIRNFQPPISGHEIMEILGLSPGRAVGRIKEAIKEAILEGTIPNEREAALTYMMRIKDQVLQETPSTPSSS